MAPDSTREPIVTLIGLEVGKDLIPLFEADSEGGNWAMDKLAPEMRRALQSELGFPFPGIRVRGNVFDIPPRSALILIDEIPELLFEVAHGESLPRK